MLHTLMLKRSYRYLAWTCLVFFTAMQVMAIIAGFFEPPDRRWLWWLVLPTPWIFLQALAIWMIATSHNQRLVVNEDFVSLRRVFNDQRLALKDVISCRWRRGNSTVLTTPDTRLVICWGDYEPSEAEPVLKWLRRRIPADRQQEWESFAFHHLMPLESRFPERTIHVVVIDRRTWAKWCLPGAFLCFLAGIVLEMGRGSTNYWVGPLPILAIWACVHFMTPPKGFKTLRLSDSPRPDSKFGLKLVGIVLSGATSLFLILVGCKLHPEYETIGLYLMVLVGFVTVSSIGYLGYHSNCEQFRRDAVQSRELVPAWEVEWLKTKP